jgi:hypothetical protein
MEGLADRLCEVIDASDLEPEEELRLLEIVVVRASSAARR